MQLESPRHSILRASIFQVLRHEEFADGCEAACNGFVIIHCYTLYLLHIILHFSIMATTYFNYKFKTVQTFLWNTSFYFYRTDHTQTDGVKL